MRIAQLANFVGPASGGMRTALRALGAGYVEAGCRRLLVVPGPEDARTSGPLGDVVQLRAPRVGGGYRLIVEPWRVIEVLEEWGPTSIELSDKSTLLPVARWARRSGVGSVLLSHERLDDMLALRTGLDATSKVSVGCSTGCWCAASTRSWSPPPTPVTSSQRSPTRRAARSYASRSGSTWTPSARTGAPVEGCGWCTPAGCRARRARTSPWPRPSSCTAAGCPCAWTSTASGRTATSWSARRRRARAVPRATSTPPPG